MITEVRKGLLQSIFHYEAISLPLEIFKSGTMEFRAEKSKGSCV